ncbi:5'-methylthioadenosine nucleosidase/S-adenosylhomocysteine nucleosidase [Mycetohabitans sp. B8]|uniref:phosphorylase family protein n=1 Tax=Mycetohabitans sp. B8 TaxID=2841845 RepID=UPI001F203D5F|nr:5'-methylthioadenosine nucleosidase/S-adenosylhomocysteine nucleosidase [Mycetohabitans sp. B8]
MHDAPVVVVTGLAFEARIAAGPDVRVICQQNAGLATSLGAIIAQNRSCSGLVSFGTAGALVKSLRPGALLVARSVLAADPRVLRQASAAARDDAMLVNARRYASDERWSHALLERLNGAVHADLAGIATPVIQAADKQRLQHACGAWAADMESHIVARIANERGLPFVCVRAIVDPAERSLPPAAIAALNDDGSTNLGAVLRSLLVHPGQLSALLALARNARDARHALVAARCRIGAAFGFPSHVGGHVTATSADY